MKWTVTWFPSAESDLASFWVTASDRQAVTDASNEIDHRLRVSPEREGEEFDGGRVLVVSPLAVTFRVRPKDCLVEVVQVRYIKKE